MKPTPERDNKEESTYLIWSIEHSAWWRPNAQGYGGLADAGEYSRAKAFEISTKANWGGELCEVPVPVSFRAEQYKVWKSKEAKA